MSKLCDRLIRRLREEGVFDVEPDGEYRIRRTYAGWHQKSAGAWLWTLEQKHGDVWLDLFGGCEPLSDLIKREKLVVYRHPFTYDLTLMEDEDNEHA